MKISSKLKRMTPTEMFKLQVQGNIGEIRSRTTGFQYIPSQFGGLEGQRLTLRSSEVIEVTEFTGDK